MSVGRDFPYIIAPIVGVNRIYPLREVFRQISVTKKAACFDGPANYILSQFAFIKGAAMTVPQEFQRVRKFRQGQDISCLERPSSGKEGIKQGAKKRILPIISKGVGTVSQHGSQIRHDHKPFPSIGDGRFKQFMKRKFTKTAMHFGPRRRCTGHHDRIPAAQWHFLISFSH